MQAAATLTLPDRPERTDRGYVCLYLGSGEEGVTIGKTRNLSESGIFLEMEERPPIGSTRELMFIWGGDTMSCTGTVTRHGHDGIGLRFVNPDPLFIMTLQEVTKPIPRIEFEPPRGW